MMNLMMQVYRNVLFLVDDANNLNSTCVSEVTESDYHPERVRRDC